MIRAVIIAMTPALRAGLRALLAGDEIVVAGESATTAAVGDIPDVDVVVVAGGELLGDADMLAGETRYGVVLLDDDPQAAARLRRRPLHGWGVLPRDTGAAELRAAVLAVAQGMVVLPAVAAERLLAPAAQVGALGGPAGEALTSREREVLTLIARGLSNKLIARELNISEHTVKFHISAIFAKLGAVSRTDAISRGAREGLITL
jgi:DNA-binding NarL/FixJ family response regulator